jgi:glutamate racemase
MRANLLAGTSYYPLAMPAPVPTILLFDSGLGGLTVFAEVLKARPDARFVYAGDDAGFPYGRSARKPSWLACSPSWRGSSICMRRTSW